ncbi:MAG: thrombospondin type 3 repeat-containing protein [Deltaproteobacteria bacterium]|nr:thrombospondin type 3 repeat-containing protein [Deltaproteobacteria bacterium]
MAGGFGCGRGILVGAAAVCLAVALAGAAGCSGGGGTAGDRGGQEAREDVPITIVDYGQEQEAADPIGPSDGEDGTRPDGTDAPVEAELPPLVCAPGEGEFLCPCEKDGDCAAAACVDTANGMVCSRTCNEDCPDGWKCGAMPGTCPDCIYMCRPIDLHLCDPCDENRDCLDHETDTGKPCVKFGLGGNFCSRSCTADTDCPSGYGCLEMESVTGEKALGCVPDDMKCRCSLLARDWGLSTTCCVQNGYGTCCGVRGCKPDGLGDCVAEAARPEECDGVDNDCNGQTDEDTQGACEWKNEFGTCPGAMVCEDGKRLCNAPPPAPDVCDSIDNDCDGETDEESVDTDGDKIRDCQDPDDDDDGVPDITDNCPTAKNPEQGNCDGDAAGDACDPDDDGDGTPDAEDCAPCNEAIHPGVIEACNALDDDCDGQIDEGLSDSEGDGIPDCVDTDDDDDGVLDVKDNCDTIPNPGQEDNDLDKDGDLCDLDDDNDGVPDAADNCPFAGNTDQRDTDGDAAGDACDTDDDDDGVADAADNCPLVKNGPAEPGPAGGQADSDADGKGDACDNDRDGDNIPDAVDNCPDRVNPAQIDTDKDGVGDDCDKDLDGDGVDEDTPNCPWMRNPDQADLDNDGDGNACDDDDDGDGVADLFDDCPYVPDTDQTNSDSDGAGDACDDDDDNDGVLDPNDNCPIDPNPGQQDANGDGKGDACSGDKDGDGVPDEEDNCKTTANPGQEDSDGDTKGDACDPDLDGDGIPNVKDNCPGLQNAMQLDTDSDGIGDGCDPDRDGDGVLDDGDGNGKPGDHPCKNGGVTACDDNCPTTFNPDQADADGIPPGDACGTDSDGDGVPNTADNCRTTFNPDQRNSDDDGQGDACDADDDNDGVEDAGDNCRTTANPGQSDIDADGLGDACDADDDGDGVLDTFDNCPAVSNDQVNTDGDKWGDACDPDSDNDGIPDTHDNCRFVKNGQGEGGAAGKQADTDADCPEPPYQADPACGNACVEDADGDGQPDDWDNCPWTYNPDQKDTNHNNKGDACESDCDGDGVSSDRDNCQTTFNPGQTDTDGDCPAGPYPTTCGDAAAPKCGDACDDDDDGDAIPDASDNCPVAFNPDQRNTDGDTAGGDACDLDDDGDGIPDVSDKCPTAKDTDQTDTDGDGMGDACDPDDDGDGVADAADRCPKVADPAQVDTDGDGLGDACDGDDDADGVADKLDNCPTARNIDQKDTDGDGLGDACDADSDSDGVPDATDTCTVVPNPDQADTDGDGSGDACDPDIDGDGVANGADNCPKSANKGQSDTDKDGLGDECDGDADNDGVPNGSDDCRLVANPEQIDTDADGAGDACDADDDGDGIADEGDRCPRLACANPACQTDTDGDGHGNDCDPDDDGDGILDTSDNCPLTANPEQADVDADGAGDACDRDSDNDQCPDDLDSCGRFDPDARCPAWACAKGVVPASACIAETCDFRDNDCNGTVDDAGTTGCTTYLRDFDSDTFGKDGDSRCSCRPAAPYTATVGGDCNDADPKVGPHGTEWCNQIDDDCDGTIDEVGAGGCKTFWRDGDGDGVGLAGDQKCLCAAAAPYSATAAGDCNDGSAAVRPGAPEACNGGDDDCDALVDEEVADTGANCPATYKRYWPDADADGSPVSGPTRCLCAADGAWTATSWTPAKSDCNDLDASVKPGAIETCATAQDDDCDADPNEEGAVGCTDFYADLDGDGHGGKAKRCLCAPRDGYASQVSNDCNDVNPAVYPGAVEACDGADNNCNGLVDDNAPAGSEWYVDMDRDGYGVGAPKAGCAPSGDYRATRSGDCDDNAATGAPIHPGALETCANGRDEDCDGETDEAGCGGCTQYYADADGDGYGDATKTSCLGGPKTGWTARPGDCDDGRADVNPEAAERCDAGAVSEDCDPADDEEGVAQGEACPASYVKFWADSDGDGVAGQAAFKCLCAATGIWKVTTPPPAWDCDDGRATVRPGATESCNGVDDDCNGIADDTEPVAGGQACPASFTAYYLDGDGDGYAWDGTRPARAGVPAWRCLCKPGTATVGGQQWAYGVAAPSTFDCNDGDAAEKPGGSELCGDGRDNDCDGQTDESGGTGCVIQYKDADGDGFGVLGVTRCACALESGWASQPGDCNDSSLAVHPGAGERCNGADDDCDGVADTERPIVGDTCPGTYTKYFPDMDGDGVAAKNPARCLCTPSGAWHVTGTSVWDCNDNNVHVHQGAIERCNMMDDDCNGEVDEAVYSAAANQCPDGSFLQYRLDADRDGFGSMEPGSIRCQCKPVAPYDALSATDCQDNDPSPFPGAPERCATPYDDNCNGECNGDNEEASGCRKTWKDHDGDGYGDPLSDPVTKCLCGPQGEWSAYNGDDTCDQVAGKTPCPKVGGPEP